MTSVPTISHPGVHAAQAWLLSCLVALLLPVSMVSAVDPKPVEDLKAGGASVRPFPQGGWSVDLKSGALLTPPMWEALESLPDLKGFSVGGDEFNDADLTRLAKRTTLQRLFFNGSGLSDAGLAVLATLPELRSFGVNHSTKLTASGLSALKDHPRITAIEFGGCIIDDTGVKTIVQLRNLTELRIGHVRITRASFPLIAALERLEFLEITPNWDPGAYSATDFAAFKVMKSLRELEVHDMVIPYEDGLSHLTAVPALKKLKLYWCCVDQADVQKFRNARPDVDVDIQHTAGEDRKQQYLRRLEELKKK